MTWECPECHSDNTDDRDMCEYCGAIRLAGATPTPASPGDRVSTAAASQQSPIAASASLVVPQPVSASVPAPISQPTSNVSASMPRVTSQPIPTLMLADPSMGEQLRLTDSAVLGRNVFPSMVSNFAMSRQHVSVHFEQGTWMVTDEGSNNGTSIMRGGQILNLVPGVGQPIHTGDILLIPAASGEYAQLRLMVTVEEPSAAQPVQPQTTAAPQESVQPQAAPVPVSTPIADSSEGIEGWFVECPECGRLHLVASERSKVTDGCDECGCSLARISAVYRSLDPGEDYADVR